jgi:hypothetical protein
VRLDILCDIANDGLCLSGDDEDEEHDRRSISKPVFLAACDSHFSGITRRVLQLQGRFFVALEEVDGSPLRVAGAVGLRLLAGDRKIH